MKNDSVWVDTDCAIGSPFGDIDDAFALLYLIKKGIEIPAVSTIFGNSFENYVFTGVKDLIELSGAESEIVRGAGFHFSKKALLLPQLKNLEKPTTFLSLGPMTNLSNVIKEDEKLVEEKVSRVIVSGINLHFPLPALRFIDFNRHKDLEAARRVFESNLPLVVVPSDLSRRFRMTYADIDRIPGEIGKYLKAKSKRWFKRSKLIKGFSTIPIWDTLAAVYVCRPELFEVRNSNTVFEPHGALSFDVYSGREVKVISDVDLVEINREFFEVISG